MLSLAIIEEMSRVLPKQYDGCLSLAERKLMAEIYGEAGLKPVELKPTRKFYKYRGSFKNRGLNYGK